MRVALAAFALLVVASASGANAPQPPAQGEAVSAKAAARALVEDSGMRDSLAASLHANRKTFIQDLFSRGVPDEARAAAAVDDILLPLMISNLESLLDAYIEVWSRHFGVEELNGMAAFDRTSVGRAWIERTPAVSADMFSAASILMPRILEDAIARRRDALRARGLNL